MVAGVGLIELIARTVDFEKSSGFDAPSVTLETAIMAAVAVAVGGAVAGLFPALHAARIRTVTALRSE